MPDQQLDGGGTVEVAGLRRHVHDLAFIGDLAFDGVHSYVADGHSAAWPPTLTDPQKQALTETMTRFLPEAPLSWLVGLGADPTATELAP